MDFVAKSSFGGYTNVGFTGQRIDVLDDGNLTMNYYKNRWYDAETGRFMSQDPLERIVIRSGITLSQYLCRNNKFSYVLNNPAIFSDMFGLMRTYNGNYQVLKNTVEEDLPKLNNIEAVGDSESIFILIINTIKMNTDTYHLIKHQYICECQYVECVSTFGIKYEKTYVDAAVFGQDFYVELPMFGERKENQLGWKEVDRSSFYSDSSSYDDKLSLLADYIEDFLSKAVYGEEFGWMKDLPFADEANDSIRILAEEYIDYLLQNATFDSEHIKDIFTIKCKQKCESMKDQVEE